MVRRQYSGMDSSSRGQSRSPDSPGIPEGNKGTIFARICRFGVVVHTLFDPDNSIFRPLGSVKKLSTRTSQLPQNFAPKKRSSR